MSSDYREKVRALVLALVMVTSVFVGTIVLSGSGMAGTATTSDEVVLGAFDQSIAESDFEITEDSPGEFGEEGTAEITLPDSVTFNQSNSDLSVRQIGNGSISSVRFTDSQTLNFNYSGFDQGSNTIIAFGQLSLDVPVGTSTPITVDVRVGTETFEEDIDVDTPSITVDGDNNSNPIQNDISVGASSRSSGFSIDVSADPDVDGQIGSGTNIVVLADESNGITFDTSLTSSNLSFRGNAGNIDNSGVSVSNSGDQLVIPVTDDFAGGENIVIQGLRINASADASNAGFTLRTTPANALGSVDNDSSAVASITKPTIEVNGGADIDVAVGANGEGSFSVDVTSASDGDIAGGTNVSLTLNNSDVTFDQSADLTGSSVNNAGSGDNDALDTDPVINENSITVEINDSLERGDFVDFTGIELNTTNTIADGTTVSVTAETRGSTGGPVISSTDESNVTNVLRPDTTYDGDTVDVDNDGEDQNALSDINVTSAVDGDIADNTNITVSIVDGSGVTFDQSDSNGLDISPNANVVSGPSINEQNVTVEVSNVNEGTTITFANIGVNVTADATNTTLAVTTNTSDSEVTTDLSDEIVVNEVSPAQIEADANISDGQGFNGFGNDDTPGNEPTVTETVTGAVSVSNSIPNFGGADVNLEIVETPDGSSGASLNTSTVTTASDGEAQFNFTVGDTTGEYVINATISGTSTGVNITYTAAPGPVADVSVTPIENAIADRSSEVGQAALFVNLTDEFGNPVDDSVTVDIFADNADSGEIAAFDDSANAGSRTNLTGPAGPADNLSDGTFDIDGNDGSSVVEIRTSTPKDVTITAQFNSAEDSGTVTAFGSLSAVNLELNETSVLREDSVQADATIVESDGTAIEVPDVTVSFGETTSNTSLGTPSDDTDSNGLASVTFTATSAGDARITASTNLKRGTANLNIDDPTLNVTLNTTEVTVDNETTVEASVTFANNDTAVEGATVNVTGSGVNVSDGTTNANGTVTFSVNASSTDTITVTATETGTNDDTATIDVTPGLPAIGDANNGPTDPDDDGQFEDVTGDGEFTTADVTFLFNNLDDPVVQNNPDAFDFNNENDGATVSDVTALLNELAES